MAVAAAVGLVGWVLGTLPGEPGPGELVTKEEQELLCDARLPFPPSSHKPIRWCHVPKTGTAWMNTVWHHGCTIPASASAADFKTMYEKNMNIKFPLKTHCPWLVDHTPATHKPIGNVEWSSHRGTFVSMLRHPAARVISAFRFGKHCIQDCNPENSGACLRVRDGARLSRCREIRHAGSLAEYANLSSVRGCASKMLVGRACNDPGALTDQERDLAVERLRSGFAFVGLVEYWDASICLFHRLFGGRPLDLEFTAVRQQKPLRKDLSPRVERILLQGFNSDLALYSAAVDMFRRLVRTQVDVLRRRRVGTDHAAEKAARGRGLLRTNASDTGRLGSQWGPGVHGPGPPGGRSTSMVATRSRHRPAG